MSSVFLTLAKLPEFKKWLASADGPLQFARHSVRSCGTDHQRGHAAHAGDRLEAANNVLTAMTLVGHKRARDRRLEEEHLARQLDDIGEDTASALQGIDLVCRVRVLNSQVVGEGGTKLVRGCVDKTISVE